jgi:hypothetical protein
VVGTELDCCIACFRIWERLPPDEPYTIDGEQLPFRIPCDTCAFRGGSQEREQEGGDYWRDLQQNLAMGGEFYCHKGVPFKAAVGRDGAVTPGERPFEYPRKEATVDIAGTCHPYQHYDKDRMRLCRGYLNQHIAPLIKQVFASA